MATYGNYGEVIDQQGKKHRIYPALFKDMKLITDLSNKFNIEAVTYHFMFDEEDALDAIYEILVMAFGKEYTKEQIDEFMDVKLAEVTIDEYLSISGYKKKVKQMELLKSQSGEDLSQL